VVDEVRRSRYAVGAVFCVHGAVTGSFATRVPWIQDHASGLIAPSVIGGIVQATNLTISFLVVTLLTCGIAALGPRTTPEDPGGSAGLT
jgi:hypothetical protein